MAPALPPSKSSTRAAGGLPSGGPSPYGRLSLRQTTDNRQQNAGRLRGEMRSVDPFEQKHVGGMVTGPQSIARPYEGACEYIWNSVDLSPSSHRSPRFIPSASSSTVASCSIETPVVLPPSSLRNEPKPKPSGLRSSPSSSLTPSSSTLTMTSPDSKPLPEPAGILSYDFRSEATKAAAKVAEASSRPIKCLQWNIERGYKLDGIIEELKKLDADVLALQEIDIGCDRSGGEDTGVRIAKALGLNYIFLCEFEEHRSPLRDASSQGGGVHGNGIMSKFDITDVQVVEHTLHPIDWENPTHALAKKEPRNGRRLTLAATIQTPQGAMAMYTAHLECFCGMLDRIHQFSDILRHSRTYGDSNMPQAIFGDLNTLAHSIARLSPNYCCDQMRWRSIGYTEAQIWDQWVLAVKDDASEPNKVNTWLRSVGLPESVCRDALNPGFEDPFDVYNDITLDVPKYRCFGYHLMTGKLDWTLLKHMEVVSKSIGNHEFDTSDHKWLIVDVNLRK